MDKGRLRNLIVFPDMIRRLLRYAVVGAMSNLVGYLLYLAITAAGVEPKLAMTLLYFSATILSFLGNKNWTFGQRGDFWPSALRYGLVYGIGYVINLLMLRILSDGMGYPHQLVQAAAVVVVAAVLFLLMNVFVFRQARSAEPSA